MTGQPEGVPAAGSAEHWLLHARSDLPEIEEDELNEAQVAAEATLAWAEKQIVRPSPRVSPAERDGAKARP